MAEAAVAEQAKANTRPETMARTSGRGSDNASRFSRRDVCRYHDVLVWRFVGSASCFGEALEADDRNSSRTFPLATSVRYSVQLDIVHGVFVHGETDNPLLSYSTFRHYVSNVLS